MPLLRGPMGGKRDHSPTLAVTFLQFAQGVLERGVAVANGYNETRYAS